HHVLAEVDRKVEVLPDDVGAVGWCADAGHNRYHAIDHDIAAAAEGVRAAYGRQGQDRQVVGDVGQDRAIELQRRRALEVEVGTGVTGLHDVLEHQRVAARATQVDRIAIQQPGFQQQAWRATAEVHRLVKDHVDQHFVADLHRTVQALGRNTGDLRIRRYHGDEDLVEIGLGTAAAGKANVVGLDAH